MASFAVANTEIEAYKEDRSIILSKEHEDNAMVIKFKNKFLQIGFNPAVWRKAVKSLALDEKEKVFLDHEM